MNYISVSGPHATLMAYCSEFYGASGRAKIPILVGFSVSFGCIVNAGKMFWHLFTGKLINYVNGKLIT